MFSRSLHLSSAFLAVALLAGCGGSSDQMAQTTPPAAPVAPAPDTTMTAPPAPAPAATPSTGTHRRTTHHRRRTTHHRRHHHSNTNSTSTPSDMGTTGTSTGGTGTNQ